MTVSLKAVVGLRGSAPGALITIQAMPSGCLTTASASVDRRPVLAHEAFCLAR